LKYTQNYNLRKPEDTDPADIQDLNYNADAIDSKIKEIEDWEAAHLQASNPHSITPALIGAETPTGAQAKVDAHEQKAAPHSGHETPSGAQEKANAALAEAKLYAENVAISSANSALNNASDYTNQVAAEINQRIDETRVKVINVEKNISDISKALTNLNPNQEAKQSISGYGILSLPKNAANGQVSDVVIKGLTATNLVKNGNFNNGVTNWTNYNSNFVANNGVAEFTATSKYGEATSNKINLIIGNKYYVKTRLRLTTLTDKVTVGLCRINGLLFPPIKPLEQTTDWQSVSGIVTVNSLYNTNNRFYIKDSRDSGFDTIYIDDVMVIDLTATFGAGNEPTKEQCDQIFTNWFDGTKSTVGASRVKAVGKNLFDNSGVSHTQIGLTYKTNGNYIEVNGTRGVGANVANIKKVDFTLLPGTYTLSLRMVGGTIENIGNFEGFYFGINSSTYAHRTYSPIKNIGEVGKRTFTIVEPLKVTTFDITPSYGGAGIGAVFKNILLECQLERNDDATPYEPYTESSAYVIATDADTGEILELRSLPNGTKDEFNIVEGKHTKRVSDPVSVSGTIFASLDTTTYVNVDVVKTTAFSDAVAGTTSKDGTTRLYDKNGAELSEVAQTDIDNAASVGKYYWHTDKTLWIIVAKGAYADITAARTGLGTMTLNYQLVNPGVRNVPAQILTGGPNHTIMWLPEVPDAGVYNNGISILIQDLPIKRLKKLSKIDFYTGEEIELNITKAVIAADKKSFTHPDLTNDDIVFFVYEYPSELSTVPEMEMEYYDSRYVVQDTENGKMYTWKIVSTNGVASIQLTEVV